LSLPWRIRPAQPGDGDAIAALHAASWRSAYRGILPDAMLGPDLDAGRRAWWHAALARTDWSAVRVAEAGDALLGFVGAWSDHETGCDVMVENLHVHPDRKGAGVGRALLGAAARAAVADGRRSLTLWVYEQNAAARRFYAGLGGRVVQAQVLDLDGTKVPELRFLWPDAAILAAACGIANPPGM
jgi:ribosomal protein S18 acetylase RimI-like enzyme